MRLDSSLRFSVILDDAGVVISIALQQYPAKAVANSITRIPESLGGPATKAASVIVLR
jgi:hypothetical protein